MKYEFMEVPISKIHVDPSRNTRTLGLGDLTDITESVKIRGIDTPVILTKRKGKDEYDLDAGYRRMAAATANKLKTVPAMVGKTEDTTVIERFMVNLTENVQREDLNPVDEALAYERLQKEFKFSVDDICGKLGVRKSRVQARFKLLKYSDVIRDAIHEGSLAIASAAEINRLPLDKQGKFVAMASDFSKGQIAKMVDKELEKIQKSLAGEAGKKTKDPSNPATITELVRTVKLRLTALAKASGMSDAADAAVKDMELRLLDEDTLKTLAGVLDESMELIPDDVEINEKAEAEISKYAEGVPGYVLDQSYPVVIHALKEGMLSLARIQAVEKASGTRRPKVTFALAKEVIEEFYDKSE